MQYSETVTKVKYCNLDSCYLPFQNDPVSSVLNRLCYFTRYQDKGLDPKPIKSNESLLILMEFVQGQCPLPSLVFHPYTQETYFNGF